MFDVVSKVSAKALKRAFPSSYGGMAQADHPWRLFQKFFGERYSKEVFCPRDKSNFTGSRDSYSEAIVYETVFGGSTDYEEATDYLHL